MEKYQFDSATKAALEKLRVPLAVYQFIDKRVVTILLSDGFCELFGFDNKDDAYYVMDHDMYRATHPEDRARAADAAYRFATEGGNYEVVYRTLTHKRTDYMIVHAIGEHIRTEDGVTLAYIWYAYEGTYTTENEDNKTSLSAAMERTVREENMIKGNYFDYLTGLPNMSYFFELAHEWRKLHLGNGGTAAVLFMDLCGMKFFNRKYSFAEGDNLLRIFADILRRHFKNENCSRYGSDHFCVITDAEGLEDTLTEIFTEFRDDNSYKSLPVRVGIYLDRNGVDDISTECDRAKYACDTMRSSYVSSFRYFSDEMHAKNESRQYFIDNLDKAIREGWIEVYYQPIIRSANGTVCDEEALVRWNDPVKGMIPPCEFISVLEEVNLIYKLDLYVTKQVLEKMKKQAEAGLYVVSESVNLSRADFNACDIVEEIRKLVDASGMSRDKINIEVTESVIGSDFEFMKSQIERFRSLGFRVWMDDFGSGYSTLDVLQSIRFDLIKFDMRFMKEFDTSEKSRIMLTELIRMAISLGVDTVCEGVETKEQADFLREIGCTMMQGYYFCRPIPFEKILERYQKGIQIGFENPEESGYYAAVGKVNLYDLAILSNDDQVSFEHYFNTVPMAIVETQNERCKMLRCNNTFRVFMEKIIGYLPLGTGISYEEGREKIGRNVIEGIRECAEHGNKLVVDGELSDGAVVHTFCKRIAVNQVTDTRAVAVAVLAITDAKNVPVTYTNIAKALSTDYVSLYYVDLLTDNFIEYRSEPFASDLEVERHGTDFFAASLRDARVRLYKKDVELFINSFTKENVLSEIDSQGAFTLSYRLLINGEPKYVSLKAVRVKSNENNIIVGVNNVDAQIRQKKALERMNQERITYSRITALSEDFICIYTVNPETDEFSEYSAISAYDALALAKEGKDFFNAALRVVKGHTHPDDIPHICREWSKENILRQINRNGIYRLYYRIMFGGRPVRVCLKAALIEESDGPQLIIGVTNMEIRADGGERPDGGD